MMLVFSTTPSFAQSGNDDFSDATVIAGINGTANGSNVAASKEVGEPDHPDDPGGASVWWRWTAPETGTAVFDTFGSDFDTVLAVYSGGSLEGLSLVASNDDAGDDVQSLVGFTAVAGTTYQIAVDGYDGEVGNIVLKWIQLAGEVQIRSLTQRPDGVFVLDCVGLPGARYALYSTGDFDTWSMEVILENPTGVFSFTTGPSSALKRFFQLRRVDP
jgi:hypothetical protein